MKKINVFIIDDSAVVREILTNELSKHQKITVIGSALDPYIARRKIVKLKIDVIILDIELPRMDGLTFLKYLMKYYPIPVIILSSLVDRNNMASVKALELGAVDIVPKPGGAYSVEDVLDQLIEKIIMASEIDFDKVKEASKKYIKEITPGKKFLTMVKTTNKLIAVGASTGGTKAFETLFRELGETFPPIVAVIHMPEKFTYTFAERLDTICPGIVSEAIHNEKILPGHIYLAPGNYHLQVKSIGAEYILKIINAPRIFNQRPSVDVLFNSVAENVGKNSIGIILTGMGRDGAQGLLQIKKAGGYTIAQDEKTSIVFGMPKEAIELGAVDEILPLQKISSRIIQIIEKV